MSDALYVPGRVTPPQDEICLSVHDDGSVSLRQPQWFLCNRLEDGIVVIESREAAIQIRDALTRAIMLWPAQPRASKS